MANDWAQVGTVLCDLDGVVWLAHRPIAGAADAVEALRASGRRVLFVTNNSAATEAEHVDALDAVGIPAAGDVVSSAMAAARMVEPGARVLVAAGPGVVEALERRGVHTVVNDGRGPSRGFDAVVVGIHRDIDYDRIAVAADAVRNGARLIGTNTDATYPTPSGLLPGGGALLAAIATAAGAEPEVAGKPRPPMAEAVAATGRVRGERVMVGDRLETDGSFARFLGARFALVRSGVTPPDAPVETGADLDVVVDLDAADLAGVAATLTSQPYTGQ